MAQGHGQSHGQGRVRRVRLLSLGVCDGGDDQEEHEGGHELDAKALVGCHAADDAITGAVGVLVAGVEGVGAEIASVGGWYQSLEEICTS